MHFNSSDSTKPLRGIRIINLRRSSAIKSKIKKGKKAI
jgi:hypothetical protein